jgi:hypothetical protein
VSAFVSIIFHSKRIFIMTLLVSPILKELDRLNPSSRAFANKLNDKLHAQAYEECVESLDHDELMWLIEYLDKARTQSVTHFALHEFNRSALTGYRCSQSPQRRLSEVYSRTQEDMRHSDGAPTIVHRPVSMPYRRPVRTARQQPRRCRSHQISEGA